MIPARKKRRARVRKLPDDPLAGGEPQPGEVAADPAG
jgi:hypothetical protein